MGLLFISLMFYLVAGSVEAKDFPFSYFVKTAYTSFNYYNQTIDNVTESECAEHCLYSFEFDCLSFDYDITESICSLSAESVTSLGVALAVDKDVNHYQRLKGECSNPAVGLEEGAIPLAQINMSSFLGGKEDGPLGISKDHVRLNSDGGWCAGEQDDINNITEWIQINFNEMKHLGGFATQGFNHPDLDPIYCSKFKVSYRNSSDAPWIFYQDTVGGGDKVFDGNFDQNTEVYNEFSNPFEAIEVRIHPIVCFNHPCVRLELYGCPVDCFPNPCKENATCTDDVIDMWNVTCTCPPGYVEDFCQVNFDECASNPCQNGATCVDHVDFYTCDCASGWEAYDCQNETDECLSNPCQNGATCTDLLDGYNCTCVDGFEGTHCENFTVECSDGFIEGIYSCYQVIDAAVNTTNYTLAQEACAKVRGSLFHPANFWELSHLSNELHNLNISVFTLFFTDLRLVGSNLTFETYDGELDLGTWVDENLLPVDYWASGYPTGSSDCIAMVLEGSSWKWRNIDCSSEIGYICQQDRTNGNFSEWSPWGKCSVTCGPGEGVQVRTRTCTSPAPLLGGEECNGPFNQTQICGEICPIVECPEGFVTRYDTCYLLRTNASESYEDAKADCQNLTEAYGGHLILLNDREEERFVSQMMFDYDVNQTVAYFSGNLFVSNQIVFDWIYVTDGDRPNMTSWRWLGKSPWGSNGDTGAGVFTTVDPGAGVFTTSDTGAGIFTTSDTDVGVFTTRDTGAGVFTTRDTGAGVFTTRDTGAGVFTTRDTGAGVFTTSETGAGVFTSSDTGAGSVTTVVSGNSFTTSGVVNTGDAVNGVPTTVSQGQTVSLVSPNGVSVGSLPQSSVTSTPVSPSGVPLTDVAESGTGNSIPGTEGEVSTSGVATAGMTTAGMQTTRVTLNGATTTPVFTTGELSTAVPTTTESVLETTAGMVQTTVSLDVLCIVLKMDGTAWKWYLETCNQTLGYICEVNLGDGLPGEWGAWSECSSDCGTGNKTRTRDCDSPAPILGGENCTAPLTDNTTCETKCPIVSCPDGFSVYYDSCYQIVSGVTERKHLVGAQSDCISRTNGTGFLTRIQTADELEFISHRIEETSLLHREILYIDMTFDNSGLYYDNSTQTVDLTGWDGPGPWAHGYPSSNEEPCMALVFDGNEWRWLMADTTCEDTHSYICEISRAPGNWGPWSGWSQCGPDCENGTQTRYRDCDNPPPYLGGDDCVGNATETRDCTYLCPEVSCGGGSQVYYDSCFLHVNESLTMNEANETCIELTNNTGHLAFVGSYGEQHFISWEIKNSGIDSQEVVYVGLEYSNSVLSYLDSEDGPNITQWGSEPVWARGFPQDAGDPCIGMVYDAKYFEWKFADVDCNQKRSFVCEITRVDGNWGSWGPWSSCSVSCLEGTQQRSRSCNDPAPRLNGAICPGNDTDVRPCSDPCPIVNCSDGYHARYDSCYLFGAVNSSGHQTFAEANETCLQVTNGTGHLAFVSDQAELEAISWILKLNNFLESVWLYIGHTVNDLTFIDDSGAADVSSWNETEGPWARHYPDMTAASADCVALKYTRRSWEWLMANVHCEDQLSYICEITQTDGNWGSWSPWTQCTISCDIAPDMGTQMRNRSCSNPAPILGGAYCIGNDTEVQACGDQCPPVHGNWSEWEYGECSESCYSWDINGTRYGGLVNRTHNCTNPAPRFYGDDCVGPAWEIVSCGTEDGNACPPINGSYSDWSNFTECSTTCGGGIRNRTRTCDNPPPQHDGADCVGPSVDYEQCNPEPCPIDGGVSSWSNWTECTVSCGGGTQYRNRSCTNPSPAYGGFDCQDALEETRNCSEHIKCPIHGNYTEWTEWSNCSLPCGGNGTRYRTRNCSNPIPRYNGDDCIGDDIEYEECGRFPCPIDGGVGHWGYWTQCSVDCGNNGVQFRYRPCNNPTPQYGGSDCDPNDMYWRRSCSAAANCSGSSGNIAPGHSTFQSSMTADGRANRAIDGNTNSSWNAGTSILTEKEPYPYWVLDLGEFTLVKDVTVHPRECICYYCYWQLIPYVVRVGPSNIPEENRRCGTIVDIEGATESATTISCDLVGRYVSVQLWLDQTPLSLSEVEVTVYSDETVGMDGPDLGMASLQIPDDQIYPSSELNSSANAASKARLGLANDTHGWMPDTQDEAPSIMVDFGQLVTLKGIATQGIPCCGKFVTGYFMRYSSDGSSWTDYQADRPKWKLIQGNTDSTGIVRHSLDGVSQVRFVEIVPQTWNDSVALRLEFYGVTEPVNGKFSSEWGEWGECSVTCEDLGTRNRSLTCTEGNHVKCLQNEQKKWFANPLQYFQVTAFASLNMEQSLNYDSVETAGNCSLLCLADASCVSFEYTANMNCTLNYEGALANNLSLWQDDSTDYYELYHTSCNSHYAVARYREQTPTDGIYTIWRTTGQINVYCDMTRDGGGWTLLVTSATNGGWDSENVVMRNESGPSLYSDYSILAYADEIRNYSVSSTFRYRIEAFERGSWGGIYEVPKSYSFVNTDNSQTASLVTRFSSWLTGNTSFQHIMPWLTTHSPALLSTHEGTDDTDYSFYGTLVCACVDYVWRPLTSYLTVYFVNETVTTPRPSTTSVPTTTPLTTTTQATTMPPTTTTGATTTPLSTTTRGTTTPPNNTTNANATTVMDTTTIPITQQMTTPKVTTRALPPTTQPSTTLNYATTETPVCTADVDTTQMIWYWVREDRYEFEPSLEWDLSGRCAYDTDLPSCDQGCPDRTVPAKIGNYDGLAASALSLVEARSESAFRCSIFLDATYIDFGNFSESCLRDIAFCSQGFTVALWLNISNSLNTNQYNYILSSAAMTIVYRDPTTTPVLVAKVFDDTVEWETITTNVPHDEWFHFAITFSSSDGLYTYVNGELQTEDTSSGSVSASLAGDYPGLILGSDVQNKDDSTYQITAAVADLKVFFRVFDATSMLLLPAESNPGQQSELCGTWYCPIHGGYSSWWVEIACSVSCGNDGVEYQLRACDSPAPQYGGDYCNGTSEKWVSCSTTGCSDNEDTALGMEDGSILDSSLNASSCANNESDCALSARYNAVNASQCWMPDSQSTFEYLQISLDDSITLKAVGTTGRDEGGGYVTNYSIAYSSDGIDWAYYRENGERRIFAGNFDNTTLVRNTLTLEQAISYVRFYPEAWESFICMRVELYGYFNPVDGNWASWGAWGDCSVTCAGGLQYRQRNCTDPAPRHLGANCVGDSQDSQACNEQPCPIDGAFGSWYADGYDNGDCTVSCGSNGIFQQSRDCDSPMPQYGGANCSGITQRWTDCVSDSCSGEEDTALGMASGSIPNSQLSVSNCSWTGTHCSSWGRVDDNDDDHCWIPEITDENQWLQVDFVDTVTLLSVGVQGRPGDDNYVTSYTLNISTDGAEWHTYEENGEIKVFMGNIDNTNVVRSSVDNESNVRYLRIQPLSWSNDTICLRAEAYGFFNPIDGGEGPWGNWSECSVTCAGGTQDRSRSCDNPSPKYNGLSCAESLTDTQVCNDFPCPINGQYGSWIDVTTCTIDCGTDGTVMQERYCDNPPPQYGGANCTGIDAQWVGCDAVAACDSSSDYALGMADGTITDDLLSCSEGSGSGYGADLARLGDSDTDNAWVPASSDVDDYLQIQLPDTITLERVAIEGRKEADNTESYVTSFFVSHSMNGQNWTFVEENGSDVLLQGNFDGVTPVVHTLSVNTDVNYVRFHPYTWENSIAMRVELYGIYNPIHGEWSSWTAWSICSVTCGGSTKTRTRTCTNPSPKYFGDDCPAADPDTETKDCGTDPCPIDGEWTAWAAWNDIPCSVSCGSQGLRRRTRTCTNPPPQYNGSYCGQPDLIEQFNTCDSNNNCGDCFESVGLYDYRIMDYQLSASSVHNDSENLPHHGRLNIAAQSGKLCWEAAHENVTNGTIQYLQVDLVTPISLYMVGVQGGEEVPQWVTWYNLSYTLDGENWYMYEEDGEVKRFLGNIDETGVVKTSLATPVDYVIGVRFIPIEWEGERPCLRVEIYGCSTPSACASNSELSISSTSEVNELGSTHILVELSSFSKVTMVRTISTGNQWIASYTLGFQQNLIDYAPYKEEGTVRTFLGNYEQDASITNVLMNPLHLKYLRLFPVTINNAVSDSITVLGCAADLPEDPGPTTTVCANSFGFSNYGFPSNRTTVSSTLPSFNDTKYLKEYARLLNPEGPDYGFSGWVSENGTVVNSMEQYIQIDFEKRVTITSLALQGVDTPWGAKTLSKLSLWYSDDDIHWYPMMQKGGTNVTILNGMTDADTIVRIELTEESQVDMRPLTLQYLQIKSEVKTNDSVGLRLEVYGCDAQVDTICPDGWADYEYSCYMVEQTTARSYTEAQAHCASLASGGHLATITTKGEQDFMRNFVRYHGDDFYFIGLDRRDMFNNLVWQDGNLLSYSSWGKGYPTDSKFERCVAMAASEDGDWNTVSCDKKLFFACEYQRETTDVVLCEENTFYANCPVNQVINVTGAELGRTAGWDVCPQVFVYSFSDLPCSHSQSMEILQNACNGQNECSILLDFAELGYPCNEPGMNLYLNASYECVESYQFVRVCEGDFLEISCSHEDEVLHIREAMYGRLLDNFVCPSPNELVQTNCSLNSSLTVIQTFCEGHHECKVPVEVASFDGDPCPGVYKYLDVDYECVSGLPVITDEYVYRGECEEGWIKHDLRCMKAFPDDRLTFEAADDRCNELHGHLAGIPGDHTQQFLEGLVDIHENTSFWIGCVQTKNNTCRWRDGIGHIYTKYNSDFISEKGVRCIELSAEHSFAWDRARCLQENSYICQQDCMLTFGLSDMTIDNDRLEVSSTKLVASLDSFKWNGRLNAPYGAWIASDRDTEQFFQVDFQRVMRVRKIATQGHPKYEYWTTKYRLDYTVNETANGSVWNTYAEDGEDKIFIGNNDSNTVHLQYLKHFMFARFLRLVPLEWHEEISLRLEVFGCYLTDNKPEVLEVTNMTKLHYEYNGTIQCRAFGTPLPTLRWERDGYDYDGGPNATIVTYQEDEFHMISEVQFHPLYDDRGYYTCVAENEFGTDRKSFYNEKGVWTYLGGKITCDDEILTMECPEGEYIRVETTFYGRLHNERCIIYDDHYPIDCEYNPDVVAYRIAEQCNNKQHCMVYVSEVMFEVSGDNYTNCNGFPLYSNTTYTCIGYQWTSWFNSDSPGDGEDTESKDAIYLAEASMCLDPYDIDCRQASNGDSYIDGGQILDRPCTLHGEGGLSCKQSSQSGSANCLDYEVRFNCPEEDFGIYEFERAVECDDEQLSISCKNDYSILVHKAFYGRREEGLCTRGNNSTYSLDCALDDELVLQMLKMNCDHKQTCKMNVELATVLSDPCPGEYKYLDIQFSCERYRQNFARFKPTNVSSLASSFFYSGLTTDFSYSTDCNAGVCAETDSEYEPWWLVDLEAVYDINVVTVYTCESEGDASSLNNFEVRIGNSSDFSSNEVCGMAVVDAQPGANTVFCNQSLIGRYVSVQVPQRLTSIKICEVDVQFLPPTKLKARACDEQILQLSCALYEVGYLKIESAFYGRATDGTLCPHNDSSHVYDQNCAANPNTVQDLVATICHDKRQCEIDVEMDILSALSTGEGNPCPSEYKYLEVQYSCVKFITGNRTYETTSQVCREEDLQIGCFGKHRFIEIVSAEYKPSTSIAPHWCTNEAAQDVDACSSQDVTSPVQSLCDNKVTCTVKAEEYFLGATSCTTQKMQLEVNFNCKDVLPSGLITLYACDGLDKELSLTCPDGEYINITDAFYGRTQVGSSSLVCPDPDGLDSTTTCRSTDTMDIVKAYCQDQRSCSLPVDQSQLTSADPCPSIGSKYLEVSYRCEVGRPKEDITLYACEDHDSLYLECPNAFPHIRIIDANYGRLEGMPRCAYKEALPSFSQFTECRTENVLQTVRDKCTNLQDCTVPSHWRGYVDSEPCIGTYKYLQVTYRCLMTPAYFQPNGDFLNFINPYPTMKNYRLSNHILSTSRERNFLECVNKCLANDQCASFNFNEVRASNGFVCQLNDMIVDEIPHDYLYSSDFKYYERESFRER